MGVDGGRQWGGMPGEPLGQAQVPGGPIDRSHDRVRNGRGAAERELVNRGHPAHAPRVTPTPRVVASRRSYRRAHRRRR